MTDKIRDDVIAEMAKAFIEQCSIDTEERYGPDSTIEDKNFIVMSSLIYIVFEAMYDIAVIKAFIDDRFGKDIDTGEYEK